MHCNLEQLEVTRLAGPRSSTAATSTHPPFPIVRLVNHSAKVGCARGNVQCFQGASSAYQSSLVAATRLAKSVRSGSSTVCDLPPALRNPPPPFFLPGAPLPQQAASSPKVFFFFVPVSGPPQVPPLPLYCGTAPVERLDARSSRLRNTTQGRVLHSATSVLLGIPARLRCLCPSSTPAQGTCCHHPPPPFTHRPPARLVWT